MSDYSIKLSSISEKKKKLIEDEQKLIEKRKIEIGQLAQRFDLLTVSDDLITGLFSFAQKSIADKADCVKEWETLGGRFRKGGKERRETKPKKAQQSKSSTAENKGAVG